MHRCAYVACGSYSKFCQMIDYLFFCIIIRLICVNVCSALNLSKHDDGDDNKQNINITTKWFM